MTEHTPGQTWRTKDGDARVTYKPEWSSSQPYCVYVRGTARVNKHSLAAAANWLREREGLTLQGGACN